MTTPAQPADAKTTGTYSPCGVCRAPVRSPFPADWTLQVRHFVGVTLLTPHMPHCQAQR